MMPMQARLRTAFILATSALLGGALPSAAQDAATAPAAVAAVYNIEIIVFRATSAPGTAEDWSAEAGARSIAGDESGSGSAVVGRFVAALASSDWQLTDIENRLRASGSYVPIAHAAWSQTASAWGTRAGFTLQKLGLDAPGLSGSVFLERGQFLHLGMALTYSMSAPPQGLGPGRIRSSRSTRAAACASTSATTSTTRHSG
jgi:hypothetical protein